MLFITKEELKETLNKKINNLCRFLNIENKIINGNILNIEKTNIAYYDRNRVTLYEGLTKLGFECVKPEGAFYLFMKTPTENEKEFCDIAAKHLCLVVPGTSFACPGYVRIAYCVSYETIVNSLPAFEKIANELKAAGKMI